MKSNKWWTLGIICFSLLMVVLDTSVVNLAVPQIIKSFSASISDVEWVNSCYLLVFGVFLVGFGALGDKIGRKKMFMAGIFTFVIGSFLCGLSGSVNELIAYRIIQGLGGAAMMPATLSLITANFEKKERGLAMGLWSAMAGLGIVLGPIIGGYLTDYGLGININDSLNIIENWRYVFYINLPLGLLALLLAWVFIGESKDQNSKKSFDVAGTIFSALAVFCLIYGLIEGQQYGWWFVNNNYSLFGQDISFRGVSIIPVLFIFSAIFMVCFIAIEKAKGSGALVDLHLFKDRNYSMGNIAGMVLQFTLAGSMFLFPLFMQSILGYSAVDSGLMLLPLAICVMIFAPIAGKLSDKIGGKIIIIAGFLLIGGGLYWLSYQTLDADFSTLVWPFIIMGSGVGLALAPLANISLMDIKESVSGAASGVFSATRQIGGVMGIAILGACLQTSFPQHLTTNIEAISDIPSEAKANIVDAAKENISSGSVEFSKEAVSIQIKEQIVANAQIDNTAVALISNISPDQIAQMKKEQEITLAAKISNIADNIITAGKQSFTDSINKTMYLSSIVALIGLISALFFQRQKNKAER